jgi:hypothetical protein
MRVWSYSMRRAMRLAVLIADIGDAVAGALEVKAALSGVGGWSGDDCERGVLSVVPVTERFYRVC